MKRPVILVRKTTADGTRRVELIEDNYGKDLVIYKRGSSGSGFAVTDEVLGILRELINEYLPDA